MRKPMLFVAVLACLVVLAAPCFAAVSTASSSTTAVSSVSSSVGQPEQLTQQEMEATTGEWVTIYRGNWIACEYQLFVNAGKYNGMWIQRINLWTFELRGNPRWSL